MSRLASACMHAMILTSFLMTQPAVGQQTDVGPMPSNDEFRASGRMMAASPQRELALAWVECVIEIARPLRAAGSTREDVLAAIAIGCGERASRLTGAMVREFGYERGNRAVAAWRTGILEGAVRSFPHREQQQPAVK